MASGTAVATRPGKQRLFPPAPAGFDATTATDRELRRHGIPPRPDPIRQPGLAAVWDHHVRRYRGFEHLQAVLTPPDAIVDPAPTGFGGLFPREACGYELSSFGVPFTVLAGTWTLPNLRFVTSPHGAVRFRTFLGIGLIDLHVEMTVDSAQRVETAVVIHTGQRLQLAVRPGDTLSTVLCMTTNSAGTAAYFVANDTTGQTVNLSMDTGFPPAVTANAGISRGFADAPLNPLAGFGTVYFDELDVYTPDGARRLTDGTPTTMVDGATTLARPVRLGSRTFKVVHAA